MKEGLEIISVGMVDEVLSEALVREPLPVGISSGSGEDAASVAIGDTNGASDDITAH